MKCHREDCKNFDGRPHLVFRSTRTGIIVENVNL